MQIINPIGNFSAYFSSFYMHIPCENGADHSAPSYSLFCFENTDILRQTKASACPRK